MTRAALIKSANYGSIHPKGARTSARHFPFVPSAAFARCIEGANEKHSPRTGLISASLKRSRYFALLLLKLITSTPASTSADPAICNSEMRSPKITYAM